MLIIMSTPGEEEDEAVDEDSAESHSPVTLAGQVREGGDVIMMSLFVCCVQVLDVLSLNLPPEKIYIPIVRLLREERGF